METFLELDRRTKQQGWISSLSSVLKQIESDNPQYAFLSLHVSYRWRSNFDSIISCKTQAFSGQNPEYLSFTKLIQDRFKPDKFVTLIDDIQAVQSRIKKGISLRMRELLTWRNIEILLTDFLAQELIRKKEQYPEESVHLPFIKSPVLAVRHPPQTLYRLLFQPEIPRIYASFPISRPREGGASDGRSSKEKMDEINRFRDMLHESFCVFDPLTIDERPLQVLFENAGQDDQSVICLKPEHRWRIPAEKTLLGEEYIDILEFQKDDIKDIAAPLPKQKSEIDRAIEERDFRLIDQSDCVVVYRPTFETGIYTGGTKAEIEYAKRTGKPIYVIDDPDEDNPKEPKTFDLEFPSSANIFNRVGRLSEKVNQTQVLRELITAIHEHAEDIIQRRLHFPGNR